MLDGEGGVNILWYNILTPPPPFKVKFEDKLETVELQSRGRIVILNHGRKLDIRYSVGCWMGGINKL